jgi:hypothetical protein
MDQFFIFCQNQGCYNVTIPSSGYCYKHLSLIPPLYTLVSRSTVVSLKSSPVAKSRFSNVFFNSTSKITVSRSVNNKQLADLVSSVKSPDTHKEPLLSSNIYTSSLFKETLKSPIQICCLCDTNNLDLKWLYCSYLICSHCLTELRALKCSQCQDLLRGPDITPQIESEIIQRQNVDTHNRVSSDAIATLNEQDIDFDPNQEYLNIGLH